MKKHSSQEAYYERLKNLANINKTLVKESQIRNLGTLIDYKRAVDGVAYGIIKENQLFYIKKGGLKQDPDVSDFAYIGGLSNITNFQYHKLAEADKQRNMLLHVISESTQIKPNKNGGKKRLNEDLAGQEIDQAEKKLDNLDTATATADASTPMNTDGAAEMDAGLSTAPIVDEPGAELSVAPEGGSEEIPAEPEGDSEEIPAEPADNMGSGEEIPAPEENGESDAATVTPEDQKSITQNEIEKLLGKATNKIRSAELTPEDVKAYVNTFLSAFKKKFDEVEIEDRKEMADKILKVVPYEDIEDVSSSLPPEEQSIDVETGGVEEGQCSECGGFAQYAESRGYNAQSIQECDDEEMSNLVSGYANAHNEGQNDGDFKAVAIFITPEIMEKLKGEYGHDEYADQLSPHVDAMNESSDEDRIAQINEIFGGLKSLGKAALGGIKKGGQAIGQAVGQAGQAVGQAVGQAGQAVKQQYYKGEINPAVKKVETDAAVLGKRIANLNNVLTKAGQQPVNVQSILQTITNQLGKGGTTASIGDKIQPSMAAEGVVDPGNVEVQPNMLKEDNEELEKDELEIGGEDTGEVENDELEIGGEDTGEVEKDSIGFAPEAQTLGVVTTKPNGAATTGVDINISPDKTVNISMNEAKQKLIKQIADGVNTYLSEASKVAGKSKPFVKTAPKENKINEEDKPSTGLSKEKKSNVVKAAKKGEDIGEKGKNFDKVANKAAKEYGSKEKGEKVAAAAMWKNIKRESEEPQNVMSESEQKLRRYIRNRLEEKAGLKKPILNESKKSEIIKKLDRVIDEQFKLFETSMKEGGQIGEGFWANMKGAFQSNAGKFENLNQNDPQAVETTFQEIFKDSLNGRFKQFRLSWAKSMSPEIKYTLMQQGYETDRLKMPDFIQDRNSPIGFKYKTLNLETPFGGGGTGGGNFSVGGGPN
jgi:hypothetical protein